MDTTKGWLKPGRFMPVAGLILVATLPFGGCYYVQAVNGQLELLRKREPIVELVDDPSFDEGTRRQLLMVLEARQFAVDELKLPDNGSYQSYADLERDFVVWNVFAAPEFSLEPKTWCFPIVGCVAYRGYFAQSAAARKATALAEEGYDVHVGGVPAYSTLGRFDDPVLNTMLRWSDADLVATLFHELAHQRLFVKGDTGFNESFATAVAEAGLHRWLSSRGQERDLEAYRRRRELEQQIAEIASDVRSQLQHLYASDLDDDAKRQQKQALLAELTKRGNVAANAAGFSGGGWWRVPLNNARLSSVGLYRGHAQQFRRLLTQCEQDFECFYERVEGMAQLSADERRAELERLSAAP